MKFINILILVFLLFISWNKFTSSQIVPEEIHIDLQAGIKHIISNYINETIPSADNIVFHKFWSETLDKNKVKVSFLYSFDDMDDEGETVIKIEGFAVLNKDIRINESNPNETEYWAFDELFISNQYIEYKEGLTISAGTN